MKSNPVENAVKHLSKADKKLAKIISKVGKIEHRAKRGGDPFHAFAESIVYQQLTGKAAATIFGRVQALFAPDTKIHPQKLLDMEVELLRKAGLSGSKTVALKDLAAKTLSGHLPSIQEI